MTKSTPYIENCDCEACRQDRHRRQLVPMWDFMRCFMKIEGVHYDRYSPKQASEIIAKAEAADHPIPDDLLMLEAVTTLAAGGAKSHSPTGDEKKERYD